MKTLRENGKKESFSSKIHATSFKVSNKLWQEFEMIKLLAHDFCSGVLL